MEFLVRRITEKSAFLRLEFWSGGGTNNKHPRLRFGTLVSDEISHEKRAMYHSWKVGCGRGGGLGDGGERGDWGDFRGGFECDEFDVDDEWIWFHERVDS